MNKKHIAIIFILTIFTLSIVNFVFALSTTKDNVEELKKESSFTFEEFINGEVSKRTDNYVSKHFVFRDEFISFSKRIKELKGIQGEEAVEIVDFKGVNVDKTHTFKSKEAKKEIKVEKTENIEPREEITGNVTDTEWGEIFIYGDSAMEINTFSENAAKNYSNSINLYSEKFPEINIYSMLVPTVIEFIDNKNYRDLSVSQKNTIKKTQNYLNPEIRKVDIYEKMKEKSKEYIYFKTDHHWTQLGAFYAYQVYAQMLGQEKPMLEDYVKETSKAYSGSLYRVTKSPKIENTKDYVEVYNPNVRHKYYSLSENKIIKNNGNMYVKDFLDTEHKYGVFLGGDQQIVKIETNNSFNRNILVLKDSYANAFVPFLVSSYDNIVVIDPRQFDKNIGDLVETENITDILFLNYALITRWDGYSQLYRKLIQ